METFETPNLWSGIELTWENILSRTFYGTDIYSHILRTYYPHDFLMHVKGDDCGWVRNPWDWSRRTLHIEIRRMDPRAKLPPRMAVHHDESRHIQDGNVIDFARMHWRLDGAALLMAVNEDLKLNLGIDSNTGEFRAPDSSRERLFSFFKAPIANLYPSKNISLKDVHRYVTGPWGKTATERLRCIENPRQRRAFKSANFDYITPSGTFTVRGKNYLVQHSGLLCLDFDHIVDVEQLFRRLLEDEYFETQLLFRSPSGCGLKWIIPIDLVKAGHEEYFESVAAYCRKVYGVEPDRQCRDVGRACFLPYDPDAYLNPERRRQP